MIRFSTAKTERNEQIRKDYDSNLYTMLDLVIKYRISASRIFTIVKELKEKEAKNGNIQNL